LKPHDLLDTAFILISSGIGRPTRASLCRAISSTYYAIFHCLANECANQFIGSNKKHRSEPAWRQVYRALEHGATKSKCANKAILQKFPAGIADFATAFVTLQERRHLADYDPHFSATKSQVWNDMVLTRDAIGKFSRCSTKDKKAFCAYVLFKDVRN